MSPNVRSVGICLEFGLPGAAEVGGTSRPRAAVPFTGRGQYRPAAPALLFDPSLRGPSLLGSRLEQEGETPLIGAGLDWPESSGFGGGLACRRVPIPLAVSHACNADAAVLAVGWPVEHQQGASAKGVALEDAVGRFLGHAMDEVQADPTGQTDTVSRLIAAVPNAMPLRGMTAVIRAAGGKARLIWRPVATLIAALEEQPKAFSTMSDDDHVLVLHLGVDGYEASLLHVIERERQGGARMRVPGRPRFVAGETNVSVPLGGVLRRMLERGAFGPSVDVAEAWARCWVSPSSASPDAVAWPIGPWARIDAGGTGAWGWFCRSARGDAAMLHRECADQFRRHCEAMIRKSGRVRAIVVSGGLSASMGELVSTIALDAGCSLPPIDCPSAVARGAAMFGWRESRRWPTYLDYLPQLRLFAEKDGEGQWCEVVSSDWIDAGDEFSEIRTGFSIPEGTPGQSARTVPLAVALEGENHVKATRDKIDLPADLACQSVPLNIQIKVQAATGDPRVTAMPAKLPGVTGVTLDWAIATSTGKTPEEYLNSRPRAYPPVERVHAAAWWSTSTKYRTIDIQDADCALFRYSGSQVAPSEYVRGVLSAQLTRYRLKKFRSIAIRRYWDTELRCWSAIASGDGVVQVHQELLDALHAKLWNLLPSAGSRVPGPHDPTNLDIIKVLAWTGFHNRGFEKFILAQLQTTKAAIHGTGNGVRSPEGCAKAIRFLSDVIKAQLENAPREVTGVNEPLRQLSWLLAQREEATSRLEDAEMLAALDAVFECALRLHRQGNRKVKFQWSIRCLVLMLSRRRFSPSFLDPASPKAIELIRFCAEVYLKVAAADDFSRDLSRQLGMSVPRSVADPNAKVARFIRGFFEYIHRRGNDSLIVEDGDDGDDD